MFLTEDYPQAPPKCLFRTKIWHVNIDNVGRICLSILKPAPTAQEVEDLKAEGKPVYAQNSYWSPVCKLASVFIQIQALLSTPNFEDPLGVAPIAQY